MDQVHINPRFLCNMLQVKILGDQNMLYLTLCLHCLVIYLRHCFSVNTVVLAGVLISCRVVVRHFHISHLFWFRNSEAQADQLRSLA